MKPIQKKIKPLFVHLMLAGLVTSWSVLGLAAEDLRKDAAAATQAANDQLLKQLPFADKTDFDNAHRGFIAALPAAHIKGEAGNLIWDPQKYGFIKDG